MSGPRSRSRLLPLLAAFLLGATLVGGSAYAAPELTIKKMKRIMVRVVHDQAPSLSVAKAKTANQAKSLAGYQVVQRVETMAGGQTNLNATVLNCPAGKRAVGGGAAIGSFQLALNQSVPSPDGRGWDVDVVRLNGNAEIDITIRVICLPV